MGHGGTLDPLATGVLILGVGNGTKSLQQFLSCTKSYEAVLLFGAATDTYDTEGKVVARKEYAHVTSELVKDALQKYRGKIMQKPPIFSAIKMNGKKLYEYARSGEEVPMEIKERPVEVLDLEMTEWMEGGTHEWHWPDAEAEKAEKEFAEKLLHLDAVDVEGQQAPAQKRKMSDGAVDQSAGPPSPKKRRTSSSGSKQERPDMASGPDATAGTPDKTSATASGTQQKQHKAPCPAPACRIRMTVTSGFYVRTLCQDLGAAVGSLGVMAKLIRTRQGQFEVGTPTVLEYDDLEKGEEVWGPQVEHMLKDWQTKESASGGAPQEAKVQPNPPKGPRAPPSRPESRRRNTSSPEA